MQVSIKQVDNGRSYEMQAQMPGGTRLHIRVTPDRLPTLAPGVVVNQILPNPGGGIRRLCDRELADPVI